MDRSINNGIDKIEGMFMSNRIEDESKERTPQSGIMLDDIGIAAVWNKGDGEYLRKIFRAVSNKNNDYQKRSSIASMFDHRLYRKFNDQTAFDEDRNFLFEPVQIDLKHDLVTNPGLARVAELATADSTHYFSHFASGTGTAAERRNDVKLSIENARVSMFDSGYQTGAGSAMKFAGFFPTGISDAEITEGGVFDDPTTGLMLFRTVYNASLTHVQYETVYTLTQTVVLNSILGV